MRDEIKNMDFFRKFLFVYSYLLQYNYIMSQLNGKQVSENSEKIVGIKKDLENASLCILSEIIHIYQNYKLSLKWSWQ